jgi:hypothetical protein
MSEAIIQLWYVQYEVVGNRFLCRYGGWINMNVCLTIDVSPTCDTRDIERESFDRVRAYCICVSIVAKTTDTCAHAPMATA